MDNFIEEGDNIYIATATGLSAGDPFVYGDYMPCVLVNDAETASPYNSVVKTEGVFDLSVKGINDLGNSAVAIGDAIFYTSGDTPKLNKKSSGKFFGIALETVNAAATATIQVRLNPIYVPVGSVTTADIADDNVTMDKIENITRGSLIVGGAADAPTITDFKTSGRIPIGDGTDLNSVAVSGDVTITSAGVVAIGTAKIEQDMIDDFTTYETFRNNVTVNLLGGGVPTGATGTTNVMNTGKNIFEYFILGAGQTLLAPTIASDGLLASLDLANNEGAEYSQGITARSKHAFTIGTSPAFYLKVGLKIADVSGTDICAVGFRKTQAYQAVFVDYTDKATLNKIAGDIYSSDALNNAADVDTDTTLNWADGESHILEVYVSAAGVVTYKVDGVAATGGAFTFDNGDVVVPFFHFLHDVTSPGAIHIYLWDCNFQ